MALSSDSGLPVMVSRCDSVGRSPLGEVGILVQQRLVERSRLGEVAGEVFGRDLVERTPRTQCRFD